VDARSRRIGRGMRPIPPSARTRHTRICSPAICAASGQAGDPRPPPSPRAGRRLTISASARRQGPSAHDRQCRSWAGRQGDLIYQHPYCPVWFKSEFFDPGQGAVQRGLIRHAWQHRVVALGSACRAGNARGAARPMPASARLGVPPYQPDPGQPVYQIRAGENVAEMAERNLSGRCGNW
jgi:hypothetical protein